MPNYKLDPETLRQILRQAHTPDQLETHPWTSSLFVRELSLNHPDRASLHQGQQLLFAIETIFIQLMPSAPPRQGKRLDTRWGEFGILAAQYFAPIRFGLPFPASLRDAWGRIDYAISLYIAQKENPLQSQGDFTLVSQEPEVAPDSTLSDWHRKGIYRLANAIQTRENYLEHSAHIAPLTDKKITVSQPLNELPKWPSAKIVSRFISFAFFVTLLASLTWLGLSLRQVYLHAIVVQGDVDQILSLVSSKPKIEQLIQAGPGLSTLRQDFLTLQNDIEPYLWITPFLDWVPTYGGDIVAAPELLTLADSMLAVADDTFQTLKPLAETFLDEAGGEDPGPGKLTAMLYTAQPGLVQSRQTLEAGLQARSRVDVQTLSPRVRNLLESRVDPLLTILSDGISVAIELPRALGATEDGPKTYLLLVQNEDELRPTGGFITAAGTLLLKDGEIVHLEFENSGFLEDWSKPYPVAPWQLQEYMNSPVLIFRDANWFTNYPTAALYAEQLYAYFSGYSADGVVAFDQHAVVEILKVTGPLEVQDAPYLVDANNVILFMRSAKTPTADQLDAPWDNKAFISKLAVAIIAKLDSGDLDSGSLLNFLLKILDERHLLIQIDNPTLGAFLTRQAWDGTVLPGDGDFVMAADFNVGYNKTNALVETSMAYEVDLSTLTSPSAKLTITHKNNASSEIACQQWGGQTLPGQKDYPLDRCYWDYLRVYKPLGTQLASAAPQAIPSAWMILGKPVPPRVDLLGEEINATEAFGTLKVVPGEQSLPTRFDFALPGTVLKTDPLSGWVTYHLRIQKQPGTVAVPVTIDILLPDGATLNSFPPGAVFERNKVTLIADLRKDIEFDLVFTPGP